MDDPNYAPLIAENARLRAALAQAEADAQTSGAERRLDNLLNSITDGLFVLDANWRFTYFNKQGADMLGLQWESLVGGNIWELFPEAEGTLFYECYHRAIETGQPEHFEEFYPTPLNIWFEAHCYPSVDGLSVIFRDITQRKQAEALLRANEALFTSLVEHAPTGVFVVGSDFRLRQVNALALPTFVNVAPLIGRDFEEIQSILWGPVIGRQLAEIFRHSLETGERYASPSFSGRREDLGVDGAFEWEIQRIALPDGSRGLVCYFDDVTEHYQKDAILQASREDLRKRTEELEALLDILPAFVWIAEGADCRKITGNRAANELIGIKPGTNISQMPTGESREVDLTVLKPDGTLFQVHELPLERAVATREPVINELLDLRFPEGRRVYTMGNAVPLLDDDGQPRGAIAAFHDVTALKQAESDLIEARKAAEGASRSKDQFLAVLSHELRTPLNPALMALKFLEENPELGAEVQEDVAMIRRNLDLEVKLIDDLLDVNRITMGKLALDWEMVDLNAILRDVCAICSPQIAAQKVTLEMALAEDLHAISADPARLRQILWNVLRNAVKFTPVGKPIFVSTARLAAELCEVRVRDSGIGIAPEVLPHIFAAFEQGDAQIAHQFGGMGLGLAICRALVGLHGGTIRAESDGPGQGATFVIELPMGPAIQPGRTLGTIEPLRSLNDGLR